MRVLTVTSIFPSRVAPTQGVFVLQRVKAVRDEGAEVRVVAPVPWVPKGPVPARYARVRATPRWEEIDGLSVRHPRYFMIPKIGMRVQDRLYAAGVAAALREEVERFKPDVIDVHYLYPDACAVARVAAELKVPYVCSARGSDVKRLARIGGIGDRIREALAGAAGVVAVSGDLADTMRSLDLCDEIEVIPNGVDPTIFFPKDRAETRRSLGFERKGPLLVCVGHLDEVHGQALLVEALPLAPADTLVCFVGGGDPAPLRRRAEALGVADRVRFEGSVPHGEVPNWFAAADASVHPGRWAGCPNAVLESLACGTPCLASDLPEMREAIPSAEEGLLFRRDKESLAKAIRDQLQRETPPAPAAPRTWREVGRAVCSWLEERIGRADAAIAR